VDQEIVHRSLLINYQLKLRIFHLVLVNVFSGFIYQEFGFYIPGTFCQSVCSHIYLVKYKNAHQLAASSALKSQDEKGSTP
jgi:hypothetical protein